MCSMKTVNVILLVIVWTSTLYGCRGPQTERGTMVDVDMANWEVLSTVQVAPPILGVGHRYQAEVELPIVKEGRYRRFRILVHGWAMNLASLQVALDGGDTWRPDLCGLYYADSASDIAEIPGAPRSIHRVEMVVRKITAPGPLVYFWGER